MDNPASEIERLEGLVRDYRFEIERLIKEKNEYLIVSAHQMKSPLSTIIFSIDTLIGEYAGKLNTKQLGIIASIKRSADTLQNLIMDIIELDSIDLVEASVAAIEELRDKINEKGIKFEVNLPNRVLIIKGHALGMKHVFYNLIENAIKYSNREGKVQFKLKYDETDMTATAVVRDFGIGIPQKEQEHIFNEFYRAPNARRFDATGTGFGMVIIKQVLDQLGGKIQLWSEENEGTRVSFSMPLLEVKARKTTIEEERTKNKRIVIIGGVTAGPKAASRARRLDPGAEITIFEKHNLLAYAGCALPYYISGQLKTQRDLARALSGFRGGPEHFTSVKDIEVKNLCEVLRIDRKNKLVCYKDIMTNQEYKVPYDSLVLATGGSPVIPEIIGVNLQNIFVLHGIHDSENIKSALANHIARDIVIVGGGLIGVEVAEALTVSGAKVTIIEKQDQILSFLDPELSGLVERHMIHRGIRILKNESVSAFVGKRTVKYVHLTNFRLPADLVILAMGINPNVGLAVHAGLNKGPTGAIAVNEYLQTNDPDIYAAGDCAESLHVVTEKPYYLPLGSIANRMGRIAGGNATGKQQVKFSPVTGTVVINVFDFHVAKTGLSEKEARVYGFEPVSSYVSEYDREHFIQGAEIINIKMTACRKTKKLLGVQIVGKGDVAKRIDVAAMVISKRGLVDDILSVDLGYAPHFSNAMGAIIVSANVLQNKLDGLFKGISAKEVLELLREKSEECVFIDVRLPQDFEEERIPGFDLIPLEDLKRRIDEILTDRKIILTCGTGARAYQAALILQANGFKDVRILEGGIRMWPYSLSRE
jgi:NADPH-dependent 2,4-dienoyl-CoA reductase/sulfur reductase-like enzyme/rhodanese-related sulfurtransferase/two-component sensor histidine kinase